MRTLCGHISPGIYVRRMCALYPSSVFSSGPYPSRIAETFSSCPSVAKAAWPMQEGIYNLGRNLTSPGTGKYLPWNYIVVQVLRITVEVADGTHDGICLMVVVVISTVPGFVLYIIAEKIGSVLEEKWRRRRIC